MALGTPLFSAVAVSAASAGQVVGTYPTVNPGDLIRLFVSEQTTAPTIGWPSGFTDDTPVAASRTNHSSFSAWKVATGSEGATFTITTSTAKSQTAVGVVIPGADSTTQVVNGNNGASSTSVVSTTAAVNANHDVILDWAAQSTSTTRTWTPPSGYTQGAAGSVAVASTIAGAVFHLDDSGTISTTGALTAVASAPGNVWSTITVVLQASVPNAAIAAAAGLTARANQGSGASLAAAAAVSAQATQRSGASLAGAAAASAQVTQQSGASLTGAAASTAKVTQQAGAGLTAASAMTAAGGDIWIVTANDNAGLVDGPAVQDHEGTAYEWLNNFDGETYAYDPHFTDSAGNVDSTNVPKAVSLAFTDLAGVTDGPGVLNMQGTAQYGAGLSDNSQAAKAVNITDLAGVTDGSLVLERVFSDSVGLADSPTAKTSSTVGTDLGTVTDTNSVSKVATPAGTSDDSGSVDSFFFDRDPQFDDDSGLTDGVLYVTGRQFDDNSGSTDTTAFDFARQIDDDSGSTDLAVVVRDQFTQTPTDLAGMTDSIIPERYTAFADPAGLTDSVAFSISTVFDNVVDIGDLDSKRFYDFNSIDPVDAVGLGDDFFFDAIPHVQAATDSTGLTDSASVVCAHFQTSQDSVGTVDSILRDLTSNGSTDDQGLTDPFVLDRTALYSDLLGLTDSFAIDRGLSFSDAEGLFDPPVFNVPSSTTDSAGLADSAAFTIGLTAPTDNAGLSDTFLAAKAINTTDTTGLTDTIDLLLVKFTTNVVVTDSTGSVDSFGRETDRIFNEIVGTTDQAYPIPTRYLTDTAGLTDSVQVAKVLIFSDSAGVSDAATPLASKFKKQQQYIPNTEPGLMTQQIPLTAMPVMTKHL